MPLIPQTLLWPLIAVALAVAAPLMWVLRRKPWLAAMCTVAVVMASGGIYLILGSPQLVPLMQQYREAREAAAPEIARLEALAAQHPDKMEIWSDLGDVHMWLNQYAQAAQAYRRAVLASNGNPQMILQYCKAQIYAANGVVTDEAQAGLEMLLKLDPANQDARYFLALRKFSDGRQEEAMADMKALYAELPEKSALKLIIDQQIGRE